MQVVRTGKPRTRKIWPEEYPFREVDKRVCTFDTETDPFKEGRIVAPFCCGFHIVDTGEYWDFWGDDCIQQFFDFLDTEMEGEKLVIYAHNGGNFDFYFMLDHFDDGMKPFVINGRLARVIMHGQEFRDSYAAVPVALEKYQKTEVNYDLFERDVREAHREYILSYLQDDCIYLGELISAWLNDFGNKTTMASVALPMLKSKHGFECMSPKEDDIIRPYYCGGRVQCFESGVIEDDFVVYDVNSMYPSVMRNYMHPVSSKPTLKRAITEKTAFAHIRAWSNGALPIRTINGLDFPIGTHDYFACIHEIHTAQELGLLDIKRVYEAWSFEVWTSFAEFIDEFYSLRQDARANDDKIHDIFFKLVMNSSYGKLAQDPRKYRDYVFNPRDTPKPLECWECAKHGYKRNDCTRCASGDFAFDGWSIDSLRAGKAVYSRPQSASGRPGGFYNVATAASITSAARAELLKGIAGADRAIYCDTDSLICRGIRGVDIDPDTLGAWKVEASGNIACIAGKKLYAVFNKEEGIEKAIKQASKGVRLTAEQIKRVAMGEVIVYTDPVPKFHLDGTADIDRTRTIRMTV